MHKKVNFFGKKLPAWLLLAALVVVGAGAATGLVLKDSVNGTTTIAVSQAILVDTPIAGTSDHDEFLATSDDDGATWAVHFEANNGDTLAFYIMLRSEAGATRDIIAQMDVTIPDGISMSVESQNQVSGEAQVGPSTWKFQVDGDADGDANGDGTFDAGEDALLVTLAIEDAQPTGFYTLTYTIVPLNS